MLYIQIKTNTQHTTMISSQQQRLPQYHSFTAGGQTFKVDTRYNFLRVIGSGAYGIVVSCNDVESSQKEKVAIKMVPRAFHDEVDAKRILREIKLLKHFRHPNIISIMDMMPPPAEEIRFIDQFNDVYIVADLMETDLHRIIYSKQGLSIDHCQYFIYQVICAINYIHSANVIHRDLKPSNLLVNSDCLLKVCDLGLARGVMPEDDTEAAEYGGSALLTEYVVTRWYRAPEIMLACQEYSKAIDLWSVGCIFAELLNRKPFFPGDDYIDQLTRICDKLGKVPEEDLDFVSSEKAKRFLRNLPDKGNVSLSRYFPEAPPDALDLLQKLLQIHPKKRITAEAALRHPFFASIRDPDSEILAERQFDYSFEDEELKRIRLRELIWQEMISFRPLCSPTPPREEEGSVRSKESTKSKSRWRKK